jgi:YVTN family beta-propeller protein
MSVTPGKLLIRLVSLGAVAALVGTASPAVNASAATTPRTSVSTASALRDVLLVGNAAGGTVSFIDGHTFASLGSFNAIPDLQQRLDAMTVIERTGYELVRSQLGDKFVDDAFLSPDGNTLYVSRANLCDVVAFDVASHRQLWRFKVDGIHADHMALSPDGSKIIVSASTVSKAQVINTATGTLAADFATGTYPHANDYSPDGTLLYNSSIGTVSLPQWLEWAKGSKLLTVVDPTTFKVLKTYSFDHGVRPAVFTPDNKTMYAQLSYFNGFIEYDLTTGTITRTINMPYSAAGAALSVDNYPGNSAHHGMAMSGDGSKLCVGGTIDGYAAIISRPALTTDRIIPVGNIPYWTLTSADGNYCFVSLSGDDTVSVISYSTAQEVARVPVGNFPQRERIGKASTATLSGLSSAAG